MTLPQTLNSIGDEAFFGCAALYYIKIPSGCMSIGKDAFSDCVSLETITVPGKCGELGDGAFSGCEKLTIYLKMANAPSGTWNPDSRPVVFSGDPDIK